jgi:hypothetical protein
MDERCIIFLHIPKTAGQTLQTMFNWRYDQEHVLNLNTLDKPLREVDLIPSETRARTRVVFGHVHYGIHAYIPNPCTYMTFLRDPVSRVVSLYRYIRHDTSHPLHDEITRSKLSLEDYVIRNMDPSQLDNGHTRQIAGLQSGEVDEKALARAKKNLSSFLFVGLTERLDESVILLHRKLGWHLPFYVTKNVSSPKTSVEVTDRAIGAIRERNQHDLELYDFASEQFSERVTNAGTFFHVKTTLFKKSNRVPNLLVRRGEGVLRKIANSSLARRVGRT